MTWKVRSQIKTTNGETLWVLWVKRKAATNKKYEILFQSSWARTIASSHNAMS